MENYSKWIDEYLGLEKEVKEQEPEDSLIEEAKKRYPEGCKVKCLYNGSLQVVGHKRIYIAHNGNVWCDFADYSNNFKLHGTTSGQWADIVK